MTQSNKQQPTAANLAQRKKANILDTVIYVILFLIFIRNYHYSFALRALILAGYPLILIPILMVFGGTPGQRLTGLILRRVSDHSRFPSLFQVYHRFVLMVTGKLLVLTGMKKKDDFFYEKQSQTVLFEHSTEFSDEDREKMLKRKAWVNFIIAAVIYIAWVIWLGNYFFLLGLVVVFDVYISKKVNWTPWKKRSGTNHWLVEWLDALIFAVVAVTVINIFLFQNYKIPTGSMEKSLLIGDHLYVSKAAYGPRIPQTPLSIPFMQHTIPGSDTKSYVEWIQLPYKRLKGFRKIRHDDPVVFNFPEGDTVTRDKNFQTISYYYLIRMEADKLRIRDENFLRVEPKSREEYYAMGRKIVRDNYPLLEKPRPVDKRDNYIKRCIGLPGDSLVIRDGVVYINGQRQKEIPGIQYNFLVSVERRLNDKKLLDIGISPKDVTYISNTVMQVPLTDQLAEELRKNKLVRDIRIMIHSKDKEYYNNQMFPHDNRYLWNLDNFGPIYIPAKGSTIDLTLETLPFYERVIGYYEENQLAVKDSIIYINNEPATQYTFKMDYYWMMGDNRHNSLDSRYWGYVPEDHIVGKPRLIWLSLNQNKKFPANIRLKRMFLTID